MSAPSPLVLSLTLFALVVWIFAFWRGGAAERWGALVILANQAVTLVLGYVGHGSPGPMGLLIQMSLDGAAAVALLMVLIRFGRPWLGVAMLLYAAQFALHSFYLVTAQNKDYLHVLLNNLNFVAIHSALAVGTALNWVRVVRLRRVARAA